MKQEWFSIETDGDGPQHKALKGTSLFLTDETGRNNKALKETSLFGLSSNFVWGRGPGAWGGGPGAYR